MTPTPDHGLLTIAVLAVASWAVLLLTAIVEHAQRRLAATDDACRGCGCGCRGTTPDTTG